MLNVGRRPKRFFACFEHCETQNYVYVDRSVDCGRRPRSTVRLQRTPARRIFVSPGLEHGPRRSAPQNGGGPSPTWRSSIHAPRAWPMAYDAPCGGSGRYARPA
eukprot:4056392-Prymnesium_polylepis.1